MNAAMNETRTRLLLVDDHGIVREGLRALLEDDQEFVIAGEAASGDEACRAVRRIQPDIVLMDLKMPGMLASDAIRVIRASNPDVKVVALTSYVDDGQVREIVAAGAQGYVLKDVTKVDRSSNNCGIVRQIRSQCSRSVNAACWN
jgi:DNA-binding NarL/FixJ family response regulator